MPQTPDAVTAVSPPASRGKPGERFAFAFDGVEVEAWPGQSIGAALLAAGIRELRRAEDGSPRGLVCGIGVCWECRCVIDGVPNRRACMTEAYPGVQVRRQLGLGE